MGWFDVSTYFCAKSGSVLVFEILTYVVPARYVKALSVILYTSLLKSELGHSSKKAKTSMHQTPNIRRRTSRYTTPSITAPEAHSKLFTQLIMEHLTSIGTLPYTNSAFTPIAVISPDRM